ncbi:hypothetical protein M433DRAFT_150209 [Acidomyces richmondensis BFW]|nr:MAG: hypothetical protein FE78DRAFT_94427 [Acidomyces sp. 'richmondensis']KYG49251.1 hypothetical protein M433DRAFT_150209 [Acidomyces richmondensis BFW]
MIGPMPFMLVAPKQGEQFLRLALSLGQIPGLPVEAKETAILATGAHFQAAYELYAHGKVARSKTGLTAQQVDDISSGKKPEGLSEQADVAYDVATYLCATPGPLKKNLWNRSMECLGKEGTAALVHYIGAYAYTCMILNAIDAPNPEGSE